MPYLALRFDADGADTEAWADALLDAGALSVEVTDPCAGTPDETPLYGEPGEMSLYGAPGEMSLYGEPGAAGGALWPVNRLTALFDAAIDPDAVLAAASAALRRTPPAHERYTVADQDWVRATQAQFAPLRITEQLWVVPSWCAPPDPGAINLTLDPGLAFGTGSHPTTRLCLEWLATSLRRAERVLDYGSGSGILAIAAAKLGAGEVVGVDVDPQAIVAGRANAERNGVVATFALADALAPGAAAQFDVVVANILANPLVLLAPLLAAHVRDGGRIVLSGVLDAQRDAVGAVYARWFTIAPWKSDGGWVALAGERIAGVPLTPDDAPQSRRI